MTVWRPLGVVLVLALVAFAPAHLRAAPGDPDPAFDGDGRLLADPTPSWDDAYGVAIDGFGRVVTTGVGYMARYHPDGRRDSTFGPGGTAAVPFGVGRDVVVQPDEAIVAVGDQPDRLARFRTNGTPDPTFGVGGQVALGFAPRAVVLQPDGNILVAGTADTGGFSDDVAVARYLPTGALDATFGTGGLVLTDGGGTLDHDRGEAIALQPDGRILVAGVAEGGVNGEDFLLLRYDANGGLDATFGTGGIVVLSSLSLFPHVGLFAADQFFGVALQRDGHIVAAGYHFNDTDNRQFVAVARFDDTGTLDPTFGPGGLLLTDVGNTPGFAAPYPLGLAVQCDDRIVVAGVRFSGGDFSGFDTLVLRYEPAGALDPTFYGGFVVIDMGGEDAAFDLAIQDDCRIVTAGYAIPGLPPGRAALARVDGDLRCCHSADHYLCRDSRPVLPPLTPILGISLVDQFHDDTFTLTRPARVCTPTEKNLEPILDVAAHMTTFRIERVSPDPALPAHWVRLSNQFGTVVGRVLGDGSLMVPSSLGIGAPEPPLSPSQHPVNHYKCHCFKMAPQRDPRRTVVLAARFVTATYRIRPSRHLCTPVDKEGEGIPDARSHLLCYQLSRISPGATTPVGAMYLNHQFGIEPRTLQKPKQLCVPSHLHVLPDGLFKPTKVGRCSQ